MTCHSWPKKKQRPSDGERGLRPSERERERLTIGVFLMLRWGRGSEEETWMGARGAPMTPRRSLRSFLRQTAVAATEGARDSCPLTQWPRPDPRRFESPTFPPPPPPPTPSSSSGSGPSITGLKLPDLPTESSGWDRQYPPVEFFFFPHERAFIGEVDRAGLTERDLALERDGDRPLRAEKNPCFFSISFFVTIHTVKEHSVREEKVLIFFFFFPSLSQCDSGERESSVYFNNGERGKREDRDLRVCWMTILPFICFRNLQSGKDARYLVIHAPGVYILSNLATHEGHVDGERLRVFWFDRTRSSVGVLWRSRR